MNLSGIFSRKTDLSTKKGKSLAQLLQKNIGEILTMSEYASGKGIVLIDPLPEQIAHLSSISFKTSAGTLILLQEAQNIENTTENLIQFEENLTLSIQVHNQLSSLITPASATSLIATQPGIFKHNKIMMLSLIFTIISLILLIGNLFFSEVLNFVIEKANIRDLVRSLLDYISIVFAATLGAGVYNLYTARKYLIERTFEPKYNSVYSVRLVLGIALGTILGLFSDEFGFTTAEEADIGSSENINIIAKLGPVVLAIVGAFSSDAVVSILQRIAETLQVVVKGSGENKVEFETQKAKNEEKNKAVNLLLEIKNQVSSGQPDSENLAKLIDKYISEN